MAGAGNTDKKDMELLIIIFSVSGFVGYVALAAGLLLADPWWYRVIGGAMLVFMVGFATYLERLMAGERVKRKTVRERQQAVLSRLLPLQRIRWFRTG